MDFSDSDEDQSLPTGLDAAGHIDTTQETRSTFDSATLTDRTVSEPPLSPNKARKRTNEEVYQRAQRPTASTTPLRSPPRNSFPGRALSEPFHARTISFEKTGFSALRHVENADTASPVKPRPANHPKMNDDRDEAPMKTGFTDDIRLYQQRLEDEYKAYETSLKDRDRSDIIDPQDWDALEDQYKLEVDPLVSQEQEIMQEFGARFQVGCNLVSRYVADRWQQFMLWMQVSGDRESERAIKRLRTRVAYVQNSEQHLDKRQEHCKCLAVHASCNVDTAYRFEGARRLPRSNESAWDVMKAMVMMLDECLMVWLSMAFRLF